MVAIFLSVAEFVVVLQEKKVHSEDDFAQNHKMYSVVFTTVSIIFGSQLMFRIRKQAALFAKFCLISLSNHFLPFLYRL